MLLSIETEDDEVDMTSRRRIGDQRSSTQLNDPSSNSSGAPYSHTDVPCDMQILTKP